MKNTRSKYSDSYQLGLRSEAIALWFLRFKGYRVLEQRYKTSVGEIDIVVRKKKTIVFVEVKARDSIAGAMESITPRMKKRITRAAEFFISQNPQLSDYEMRFDLIAFAPFFKIHHLDNAW